MKMKPLVSIMSVISLLFSITGTVVAEEIDEETGLIVDDNLELIKNNCTVCHSAQNIIRQAGTRLTWLGLIQWMQKTQGLWEFDADTETKLLDYLESNYGPKEENYRRTLIPASLMPPNPYQTQAALKFVNLQETYQVGDTINMELNTDFQDYSQGPIDLWVAVKLPKSADSEFLFVTGMPSVPEFGFKPQPFQQSLKSQDDTYGVLKDFTMPALEKGEYVLYALAVEEGVNPLQELERNRSNLVIQAITIADK